MEAYFFFAVFVFLAVVPIVNVTWTFGWVLIGLILLWSSRYNWKRTQQSLYIDILAEKIEGIRQFKINERRVCLNLFIGGLFFLLISVGRVVLHCYFYI